MDLLLAAGRALACDQISAGRADIDELCNW
jgi:hypothetical protein